MSDRISIGERGVRFPDDGNCNVNEDKKKKCPKIIKEDA